MIHELILRHVLFVVDVSCVYSAYAIAWMAQNPHCQRTLGVEGEATPKGKSAGSFRGAWSGSERKDAAAGAVDGV